MKKKYIIVQNSDRVDLLTSCKVTYNFGASVTFPLKFRHCVEAIFVILSFESDLRTLDTSNVELVFFLFCYTTLYYFRKDVWRMLSKKDKVPTALGSCYSLCIWKIHRSKINSYILSEN